MSRRELIVPAVVKGDEFLKNSDENDTGKGPHASSNIHCKRQ